MRKFTFDEMVSLIGRLRLFAWSFYCEVCDKQRPSDMIAVTLDNVPICLCLDCSLDLIAESNKRRPKVTASAVPVNGASKPVAVKRGRPRKAVKR